MAGERHGRPRHRAVDCRHVAIGARLRVDSWPDVCPNSQRHHRCPAGHRRGRRGAGGPSGGRPRGVASARRARLPDDIRRRGCQRPGSRYHRAEGARERRPHGRSIWRAPRRIDVRRARRYSPSSGRDRPARPRHCPCAPVRVRLDRGGTRSSADPVHRCQCRGEAGDVGPRHVRTDPTARATGAAGGARPVAAAVGRDVHTGDRRGLSGDGGRAARARRGRPSGCARRAARGGRRRRPGRSTLAPPVHALWPRS